MNIDINLVNSLKVGEFIQVSDTEVLACVEWDGCHRCMFDSQDDYDCPICHDGDIDLAYKLFKLKQ